MRVGRRKRRPYRRADGPEVRPYQRKRGLKLRATPGAVRWLAQPAAHVPAEEERGGRLGRALGGQTALRLAGGGLRGGPSQSGIVLKRMDWGCAWAHKEYNRQA